MNTQSSKLERRAGNFEKAKICICLNIIEFVRYVLFLYYRWSTSIP